MNHDDIAEIKMIFLEEAREILSGMEKCLLLLEKNHSDLGNIDELFRFAHNLKGSSAIVGFSEMTSITHKFESILISIRNRQPKKLIKICTLLFRTKDYLCKMVEDLTENLEHQHSNPDLHEELCSVIITTQNGSDKMMKTTEQIEFIDSAMMTEIQSQLAVSVNPILVQNQALPKKSIGEDSIRVKFSRIENLLNNMGELSILQNVLLQQTINHSSTIPVLLRETASSMSKIIKDTQTIMMGLRMVPLRQTFQKMERIVRDTSAELDKDAELVICGEDTEIDKKVLERIADPLVHIIRNAVDHGLEEKDERKQKQKSKVGKIFLSAYHRAGNLVIEARDDGRGLDPEKLTKKAIEKGLISPDKKLSQEDAFQLIFSPGFSTKEQVTSVSGRGVGMDVVKTNITAIQGHIEIESELGNGTCLRITLPLTMAIVDSVIVRIENERYVIPLAQVSEFLSPLASDFESALGNTALLSLRDETLTVSHLSFLLNRPFRKGLKENQKALVIRNSKNQGAVVLVDQIICQQQVVVKPLGQELRGQVGLLGSAILGDGRPAIILDLLELLNKNQHSNRNQKHRNQKHRNQNGEAS